jgi:DNA-binding transcriptional MocR family regulator
MLAPNTGTGFAASCQNCGALRTISGEPCCSRPNYIPAGKAAAKALAENPNLSDRAIADKIGVSHTTIQNARKATGKKLPVEKRTGLDGKARKMPKPKTKAKAKPAKAPSAREIEQEAINAWGVRLLKFAQSYCSEIRAWRKQNPRLCREGRESLLSNLHTVANELSECAQLFMANSEEESSHD